MRIVEELVQEDNVPDFILGIQSTRNVIVTRVVPADFDRKPLSILTDRGRRKLRTQHFIGTCGVKLAGR
jgi:hypothetical protein